MKKSLLTILIFIYSLSFQISGQQLNKTGLLYQDISKISWIKKAMPQPVLRKIAVSVDNSAHLPPVGNQGNQGSCVAWAFGYYYKTYQEWQEHGWSVTDPNHIFSPSFIYNNIDGGVDGGAFFSDAMKLLLDNGCATIAEFPYQSDYTLFPNESVYRDAINYRADSAFYIQTNDINGINQVKQLLAEGNVAVLGIIIRGNFDNIKNYNNTYCVKDTMGNNRGGHALTLVGYDDNKVTDDGTGAFKLVNQWGTNWGDNGFCWMSYKAVMDSSISQRIVCYTTDKINYKPSIIASVQISHSNMNLLNLNIGIGTNTAPLYSKDFFNFYENTMPWLPPRAFPDSKIDFDISDGLTYLDTVKTNNIFLKTQSTVQGTVNNFSVTDLRVGYTSTSAETPKVIPDNNQSVFTNLNFKISHESNIATSTIALLQGWNLVSIPVIADSMSSSLLFTGANSPMYNYTNKYNVVTSLENGKGYWVRYPNTDTVSITGRIVNSTSIPITAGWNLISGYEKNVNISQATTTPWGIINSPFYGYNNKYEVIGIMEAGKSYWVRASQDGVINIENALAKNNNKIVLGGEINPKWIKIIVTDSKGDRRIVYGAAEPINFDNFALPPLPPDGVFDVRWDSNQLTEEINSGVKTLSVYSAEYPITLKVEGGDLKVSDRINGKIINAVVEDGQSIIISNSAIEKLQIASIKYPISYALYQNYPNPFNPSTTISYQLPEESYITLKVYDMLGREVKVLESGIKSAGTYNQTFNADNLSSGIYFYSIDARSKVSNKEFTKVGKMILLK